MTQADLDTHMAALGWYCVQRLVTLDIKTYAKLGRTDRIRVGLVDPIDDDLAAIALAAAADERPPGMKLPGGRF